jgi:hypothetical protein
MMGLEKLIASTCCGDRNSRLGTDPRPIYKESIMPKYVVHTLADTSRPGDMDFPPQYSLEESLRRSWPESLILAARCVLMMAEKFSGEEANGSRGTRQEFSLGLDPFPYGKITCGTSMRRE